MNTSTGRSAAAVAAALGLLMPIAIILGATPAAAATIRSVTDGGDTGAAGQLRQVVAAAAPGDTITFTVPVVTLTQGEVVIIGALTIRGGHGAAGRTTITRSATAAPFRIFHTGAPVTLDLLTVSGGLATDSFGGGGILNEDVLTLTRSTIESNNVNVTTGEAHGGGIATGFGTTLTVSNSRILTNHVTSTSTLQATGGGISVHGVLTVVNSEVTGNTVSTTAAGSGGGIAADVTGDAFSVSDSAVRNNTVTAATTASGGGLYVSDRPLTLSNSVIQGNMATTTGPSGNTAFGGGMQVAGSVNNTIDRTEISDNVSSASGGGAGLSGGMDLGFGAFTVTNSTISGNSASGIAGAFRLAGGSSSATFSFTTVAGNVSSVAAIFGAGSPVTLNNSIVANPGSAANCNGTITLTGANDTFGNNGPCVGSILTDPLLAAAATNGGVGRTMSLGAMSPALNAAVGCPATGQIDQRGFVRPAAPNCDLGAYESGATLPDAAPPVCAIVLVLVGNPRAMDVSAKDLVRGLQTISNAIATNGKVIVPYFTPGSTLPVILAAVKANQALSTSWSFQAVDQAGNSRLCT